MKLKTDLNNQKQVAYQYKNGKVGGSIVRC